MGWSQLSYDEEGNEASSLIDVPSALNHRKLTRINHRSISLYYHTYQGASERFSIFTLRTRSYFHAAESRPCILLRDSQWAAWANARGRKSPHHACHQRRASRSARARGLPLTDGFCGCRCEKAESGQADSTASTCPAAAPSVASPALPLLSPVSPEDRSAARNMHAACYYTWLSRPDTLVLQKSVLRACKSAKAGWTMRAQYTHARCGERTVCM